MDELGITCTYCKKPCNNDLVVSSVVGHYKVSLDTLDEDEFVPTLVGTYCSYEHLCLHLKTKLVPNDQELIDGILSFVKE